MNQVERWFGLLTDKLIRRGVHTSVQALESDIRELDRHLEHQPRPFTWTKTADEILNSLADYLAKVGASHHVNKQNWHPSKFVAQNTSGGSLIRDVEVQAVACRDRVDQGLQLRGWGRF